VQPDSSQLKETDPTRFAAARYRKTSRPEIRHRYCLDARAGKNSAQNHQGNAKLHNGNESLTMITVVEQSAW